MSAGLGRDTEASLAGRVELRLDDAKNGRIRNGAVVHRLSVYNRDGVDQTLLLDAAHHVGMLSHHFRATRVVIGDLSAVAVAVLDLGTDDGSDLLRRPGRTSTATEARRLCREVEDLNGNLGHSRSLSDAYRAAGTEPGAHSTSDALGLINRITVRSRIRATGEGHDGPLRAYPPCGATGGPVARGGIDTHAGHDRPFLARTEPTAGLYPMGYQMQVPVRRISVGLRTER